MGLLEKLLGRGRQVIPEHVADQEGFRRLVLDSELPVMVNVWSSTCPPCRQLALVMVDVATRYEGRVRVAEINTQAQPELVRALEVSATPTVIVYSRGEEVGRVVGFRARRWFDRMIAAEFSES